MLCLFLYIPKPNSTREIFMELNEKLLELRKQKGLTQEELAQELFVSRTAISKWESGRGVPNIDSLKAISRFFGVSLDNLLSSDSLLMIAEDDRKHRDAHMRDLIFGLLDCSMMLLIFLPFFGQEDQDAMYAVSLLSLTNIQSYLKFSYCLLVISTSVFGCLVLSLQNCEHFLWKKQKPRASLLLNIALVLLFLLSRQPYAATFTFLLLIMKGAILIKQR